jgi:hypothetical protein
MMTGGRSLVPTGPPSFGGQTPSEALNAREGPTRQKQLEYIYDFLIEN